MWVYKYDLSGLRDTTLRVVCQIDEYIGRDSVKTLRRAVLGNVYSAWDSTYVTTLSLHFVPLSDSTASLHCGMKERGQVGTFLRFRKAEPDFKYYNSYRPKPFTPCGLKPGEMVLVILVTLVLSLFGGLLLGWSFTGITRENLNAGLAVRFVIPWLDMARGFAMAAGLSLLMAALSAFGIRPSR